jgi:hypothetical protein
MKHFRGVSVATQKRLFSFFLVLLGVATATVSLSENTDRDFAALGIQGWVLILALPFAAGLSIALAVVDRSRTSQPGATWVHRVVHAVLVFGAALGFAVGYLDVLFEVENQNNVFGGMFMAGFGVGLALKWTLVPESGSSVTARD